MKILHILFDGPDALARRIISEQDLPGSGIEAKILDMSDGSVDAGELVDEIERADKVISWHR